ncbi:endonuclease domain-containing protein [Henriciella litoralis]|uniref:endonuclease domain-containing protein n=1 Tax=Henriciella litoralis TaxID=568102 RepID=UPI00146D62AB|nr:DUF559 domain-containing protein [Henriciella litoralis]
MTDHPSTQRARSLRRQANLPERKAWETLRQLREEGFAVRRQVAIEGLTVDFAIRQIRLVIEIDGSIHEREDVRLNDMERDARLEAAGWRILRLSAETAMSPDHLITAVRAEIERLKA